MDGARLGIVSFVLFSAITSSAAFATTHGEVISQCAPDCVPDIAQPVRIEAPEISASGAGGAVALLAAAVLMFRERVRRQ